MKIASFLIFILLVSFLTGCSEKEPKRPTSIPMVVSISTDGRYVISTHLNKEVVLWDIQNRTKEIFSNEANIYSAYFIKDSHSFMWQSASVHTVYIQNVEGFTQTFFGLSFPTYGHVISSDRKHYFASDKNWNIYTWANNKERLLVKEYNDMSFGGAGKIITFLLRDNWLVTAGTASETNGIHIWDISTHKPIFNFIGNFVQTVAALSPDGRYLVGGDSNTRAYVWDTQTGKRKFELDNLLAGRFIDRYDGICYWDKRDFVPPPQAYLDADDVRHEDVYALKFIDKTHYLRFTTHIPYTILYDIDSPKHLKFIPLGENPYPSVTRYDRDAAIDTAWQAHILVVGQAFGDGIIVYRYHPETQTLEKIWAPSLYEKKPKKKAFFKWLF